MNSTMKSDIKCDAHRLTITIDEGHDRSRNNKTSARIIVNNVEKFV